MATKTDIATTAPSSAPQVPRCTTAWTGTARAVAAAGPPGFRAAAAWIARTTARRSGWIRFTLPRTPLRRRSGPRRALAAIALVAALWIGWQSLNTVGRALLVAIVAAAAAYLLPTDGEPGDNSWEEGDAGADDSE
jgi:hypothetical protein